MQRTDRSNKVIKLPLPGLTFNNKNMLTQNEDKFVRQLQSTPPFELLILKFKGKNSDEITRYLEILKDNFLKTHHPLWLEFYDNNIDDNGANYIADMLRNHNKIYGIDLSLTTISEDATDNLISALRENHSLIYLQFWSNPFDYVRRADLHHQTFLTLKQSEDFIHLLKHNHTICKLSFPLICDNHEDLKIQRDEVNALTTVNENLWSEAKNVFEKFSNQEEKPELSIKDFHIFKYFQRCLNLFSKRITLEKQKADIYSMTDEDMNLFMQKVRGYIIENFWKLTGVCKNIQENYNEHPELALLNNQYIFSKILDYITLWDVKVEPSIPLLNIVDDTTLVGNNENLSETI